jgi:hypothetical protein
VLVILLPTVDRDLQIKLFRAATGDDRKPIDQVLEEQPAWHNLILGRPSESSIQDHLNFGWVTTISRSGAGRGHCTRLCGERPADVHWLTSVIQISAGYPYIRPQTLPQGTVTAAGRGHILRATARRR